MSLKAFKLCFNNISFVFANVEWSWSRLPSFNPLSNPLSTLLGVSVRTNRSPNDVSISVSMVTTTAAASDWCWIKCWMYVETVCRPHQSTNLPKGTFKNQGPVVRSLVSANRWLRGMKSYTFPWYLTLVSANHASSNPGQITRTLFQIHQDQESYFHVNELIDAMFTVKGRCNCVS